MKLTPLDRLLLLATAVLASYQVAVGIDGFSTLPIISYTIAFGTLLVAGLLVFILGFDVLEAPTVVIVSSVIPLGLATGLIWQYVPSIRIPYLAFALLGLVIIGLSRLLPFPGRLPAIVVAVVHAVAGITIFLLPILLSVQLQTHPFFSLVAVGGALIGLGGLLLSFLRTGRPILSRETIFRILPGLLLLMTACFVAGFKFG